MGKKKQCVSCGVSKTTYEDGVCKSCRKNKPKNTEKKTAPVSKSAKKEPLMKSQKRSGLTKEQTKLLNSPDLSKEELRVLVFNSSLSTDAMYAIGLDGFTKGKEFSSASAIIQADHKNYPAGNKFDLNGKLAEALWARMINDMYLVSDDLWEEALRIPDPWMVSSLIRFSESEEALTTLSQTLSELPRERHKGKGIDRSDRVLLNRTAANRNAPRELQEAVVKWTKDRYPKLSNKELQELVPGSWKNLRKSLKSTK